MNATTFDRVLAVIKLAALLLGARTVSYLAVLAAAAAFPLLAGRFFGREVTWEAAMYGWPGR